MNDLILRTLIYFLIVFGICLIINLLISIREKKTDAWARTLGWVIVIPAFTISAYFGGVVFLIAVMLLVSIGAEEFYFLAERSRIRPFKITGTAFSVLLPLIAFLGGSEAFHVAAVLLALTILALPIYKRQIKKDLTTDIQASSITILGILYVGWTSGYLILIRNMPSGFNFILFFYLLIIANDVSSYYFGKLFGKTKIFQFISPGKSLQGALGGLVATIGAAYLLSYLPPVKEFRYVLLLGVLISISGQLGDMVESSLKREAGIKDAGGLLPGFGGILDRFDSLIYASPLVYLFLVLITS